MPLISMSYATNTWSSHQTAFLSFRTFCITTNSSAQLPVHPITLTKYIKFLKTWRKLQASTIASYLSSIKVLHFLNGYPKRLVEDIFSHFLVTNALKGISNTCLLNPKPSNPRRVMTFPCLKLLGKILDLLNTYFLIKKKNIAFTFFVFFFFFNYHCCQYIPPPSRLNKARIFFKGHGLVTQGFSEFDTQIIWSACVLAFWGSFRMSELLPSGQKPHQTCNALTWGKVFKPQSKQITISIKFPKSMKDGKADAVDVYKYIDKAYCPVHQLIKLYNLMQDTKKFDNNDFVFRLGSGKLLTLSVLNQIIGSTMAQFFDGTHKFSNHSFRAGLPASMATQPHLFNEEEIKVIGRWTSEAFKRYCRLTGISREFAMDKIHDLVANRYTPPTPLPSPTYCKQSS